jgi:hypothetical protein
MSSRDNTKDNCSRRSVLTLIGAAGAALMVGSRPMRAQGAAQDLPHLDPSDPTAKALGYTEDATKVDKSRFPAFKPAARCANCNFFQGTGGPYGPCQIFPGKSVSANGWCASHSPKAS